MYHILIADDEAGIRNGLARYLKNHAPDFEVVGTAKDGKEALRLSEELLPEVIITDINMPKLDGLEYLESLKELLPDSKFLVISGYDRFDYAVRCLRLGVREYFLKPVDTQKLLEVLKSLKEELDEQRDAWKLKGQKEREGADEKQGEQPGLRYLYCAAMARGQADFDEIYERAKLRLAPDIEILKPMFRTDERLLYLRVEKEEAGQEFLKITRTLTSVCNYFRREQGKRIHFFLGNFVEEKDKLGLSRKEALRCGEAFFEDQIPPVVCYEEMVAAEEEKAPFFVRDISEKMVLTAESGSRKELRGQWEALKGILSERQLYDAKCLKIFFLSLGFQVMSDMEKQTDGIGIRELNEYEDRLSGAESPDELYGFFTEFLDALERKCQEKDNRNHRVRERAQPIIQAHLSDSDFCLDDVAVKLFLSPNYLRALWKRETGMTFTEYITELRMERARILLKGKDRKIGDVAEQVGYRDSRYFSSSFKKLYHMSPGEYQNQESRRDEIDEE